MKSCTLAAMDIGSNAIRLLICDVEDLIKNNEAKKTAYLRVPIRLGEDVFKSGRISDEKMRRVNETFMGFNYLIKAYNVKHFHACATSAMRDAENGPGLIAEVFKNSGINIETISGQKEADIIYKAGGLMEFMDGNKNYLYVDVGGGSTEMVVYCNNDKKKSSSFKIGTLRILAGAVLEDDCRLFKESLEKLGDSYSDLNIIASGGNINKTAKLLNKKNGEVISYLELKDFYEAIFPLSLEERLKQYKMNTYRADVIIPALKIFLTIGKLCKVKNYYVPKIGLVDGIINELYEEKIKPSLAVS